MEKTKRMSATIECPPPSPFFSISEEYLMLKNRCIGDYNNIDDYNKYYSLIGGITHVVNE
jgi:hypothetical protein